MMISKNPFIFLFLFIYLFIYLLHSYVLYWKIIFLKSIILFFIEKWGIMNYKKSCLKIVAF